MISLNWKWLVEAPLTPAWRSRLDLALGVVFSGAAVVALSSTIHPDPAKLAARHGDLLPFATSAQPLSQMSEPPEIARVQLTQAMIAAAQAGDVVAMKKAYRLDMRLEGTLQMAARSGHKDAVVWLLTQGADIHDEESSVSAPILAADAFPEIVALLREKGVAEPSVENAAGANAPNALAMALTQHPRQAENGLRPAVVSTMGTPGSKQRVVTMLLDAGADPNTMTGPGGSALGDAVETCEMGYGYENVKTDCMAIVRLLLDHGARVTGDALGDALSLEDATRSAPLEALFERPIDKGVTAAALANATSVSAEDLQRIMKLGVDWTWHDGEADEALPVLAAVRRGDRDYTRTLLEAGAPADVHFKEGTSALTEALEGSADDEERARIVELLVTHGANVNQRLPDGRTPLFAAAESGNLRVIHFLIAHGARVNDRVLDDTALDAAEQHGNLAAERVLDAYGGRRAARRSTE